MKQLQILLLFILFSLFLNSEIHSQTISNNYSLSGYIVENESKKPLEFCNIVLKCDTCKFLTAGSITDKTGFFKLSNLNTGLYRLEINYIGFEKQIIESIRISEANSQIQIDTIKLTPSDNKIQEITIQTGKQEISFEFDKEIVNVSKLTNVKNMIALDALRNVPSLHIDANDKISIRGADEIIILIDNKRTSLSTTNILKQIPANSIENIEIITNPSAKYSSEGNYAIINIVMKQKREISTNSIVNTRFSTQGDYGGDILTNHNTKKIKFFWGAYYSKNISKTYEKSDRTENINESSELLFTNSIETEKYLGKYIEGGFDLNMKKKQTLTFSSIVSFANSELRNTSKYKTINNNNLQNYKYFEYLQDSKNLWNETSITYHRDFENENQSLDINGCFNYSNSTQNESEIGGLANNSNVWDKTVLSENRIIEPQTSRNLNFDLDFSQPIKKILLQTGFSFSSKESEFEYDYQNFDRIENSWISNPTMSNPFDYKRNNYSVYSVISFHLKRLSFKTGVRANYQERTTTYNNLIPANRFNCFGLFPTFSVSFKLSENKQFMLKFRKYQEQPDMYMINPNPTYLHEFEYTKGNPNLKPEYYNSFSFDYSQELKNGTIDAGIFHKETQNYFTNSIEKNDETLIRTWSNISNYSKTGLELSYINTYFKWLEINPYIQFFRYSIKGETVSKLIPKYSNSFDFNCDMTIKLGKINILLYGSYTPEKYTANGKSFSTFSFTPILKYNCLKKKGNIRISFYNYFNSDRIRTYLEQLNYQMESSYSFKQYVLFSFSYIFNEYEEPRNLPNSGLK